MSNVTLSLELSCSPSSTQAIFPKENVPRDGSVLEEEDVSREQALAFAALTPSAIPYCWNVPLSGVNKD